MDRTAHANGGRRPSTSSEYIGSPPRIGESNSGKPSVRRPITQQKSRAPSSSGSRTRSAAGSGTSGPGSRQASCGTPGKISRVASQISLATSSARGPTGPAQGRFPSSFISSSSSPAQSVIFSTAGSAPPTSADTSREVNEHELEVDLKADTDNEFPCDEDLNEPEIPEISNHDFYARFLFLKVLRNAHAERHTRDFELADLNYPNLKILHKDFLDAVAYVCDYKTGGDSVTACTLQSSKPKDPPGCKVDDRFECALWVAANAGHTQSDNVKVFLDWLVKDLFRDRRREWDDKAKRVAMNMILRYTVELASCKRNDAPGQQVCCPHPRRWGPKNKDGSPRRYERHRLDFYWKSVCHYAEKCRPFLKSLGGQNASGSHVLGEQTSTGSSQPTRPGKSNQLSLLATMR